MKFFTNGWNELTAGHKFGLFLWVLAVALLMLVVAVRLVSDADNHRLKSISQQAQQMDPTRPDPGVTAADMSLPANAQPTKVTAGIYVDRIVELSIKDTGWTVDFYLWFRWNGEPIEGIERFDAVDGSIESRTLEAEYTHGDEHYLMYRVVAQITKFFDISRFPCDDHLLTIAIEHPGKLRHELMFVADEKDSTVSSRAKAPGYKISQAKIVEKAHSYKTARGDPRLPGGGGVKATHSQLRYGLGISRVGWSFYFKMFQGLFVAVAIATLALFIKPTNVDPRFGLGIGSLFAAVANSYMTAQLEPDTGEIALADYINGIGIGMIFLIQIQSTISLYLFEARGQKALSRWFDKISFVVFVLGYTGINLMLPLSAAL
jgi:hypothetical protein